MITKFGYDGSTNHPILNIKDDENNNDYITLDTNIITTFICPIKLIIENSNIILWSNPVPASPKYCRPVEIIHKKETESTIKEIENKIQDAIRNLLPTIKDNITIHHILVQTMIDGKVCQTISDIKSRSSCYICKPSTKPSSMNNLNEIKKKSIVSSFLELGVSPLHLYINTMECILHIAYKQSIKKWSPRGIKNKEIIKKKKIEIQKGLKDELGINVDKPLPGSTGNTNTGNVARKFFKEYKITSKITGIKEELIKRFYIILITLNSGFDIDSNKYKEYAEETAKLYIDSYKWYYMPLSVHKMLLHGSEIIEALPITIGESSEEAIEATHKYIRKTFKDHTLKISRRRINEDIINWLLISSDPLIASSMTNKRKSKDPLPSECLELLKEPPVPN